MPVDQMAKLVTVENPDSILVRLQGPPDHPLRQISWRDIVGVSFQGLTLSIKAHGHSWNKPRNTEEID